MICVNKPKAEKIYWGDKEPPIYSASFAVVNPLDTESVQQAEEFEKEELKKDNKLFYYVLNETQKEEKVDTIFKPRYNHGGED